MDDFDIRAVSENEAYNMKKAVVSYKENLDSVIKKINNIDYATYKKGFKGKQVDTVIAYMNKTVSEMLKMSSFILEFETAIDKVINNYILMSGSIKTSDVTTASVEGEGDLSGVKDFDGNGSVNSNIISTPINNNSVTSFDGENINTEEVIPPIVSIEPESPITSFSGEQVSNNELSNSTLSKDGLVLGSGIGDYNVTIGHDSAEWAVNGINPEHLASKYVNPENSIFHRFAVVNEDGSIAKIVTDNNISIKDYCNANNIDISRVALDVSNIEGSPQAWISIEELIKKND